MIDARARRRDRLNVYDIVSYGLSGIIVLVVLALLIFEPARQAVGVSLSDREWKTLIAGFALGVGVIIALDDRLSAFLTSRNILGWVFMLIGAYLLFGESLLPLGAEVWVAIVRVLTPWRVVAMLVGIALIVVPAYIYRRRNR